VRVDDRPRGWWCDDAGKCGRPDLHDLLPGDCAPEIRAGGHERVVLLHHQCVQGAVQRRARTHPWPDAGVERAAEPGNPCRNLHRSVADRPHPPTTVRRLASRLCVRRLAAPRGVAVMRRHRFGGFYRFVLVTFAFSLFPCPFYLSAAQPPELKWAGDPEGGAPFVEADPSDPSKVTGFDVEIGELIAKGVNRAPHFLFVPYGSIDQAIERGTAEMGLSGMEDTPARRSAMATTIPYYAFREVL